MITLSIILAVLILLALLRFGVEAEYNAGGFIATVRVGAFRFRAYPRKVRIKKSHKKEKPKAKKEKKPEKEQEEKKKGIKWDLHEILLTAGNTLGRLRRKLLIKRLTILYIAAGSDPAKAAMAYGGANAAFGVILPLLEKSFRIKHRDLQARTDFDREKPEVYIDAIISIAVWEAVYIAFAVVPFVLKSISKTNRPVNRKDDDTDGQTPDK